MRPCRNASRPIVSSRASWQPHRREKSVSKRSVESQFMDMLGVGFGLISHTVVMRARMLRALTSAGVPSREVG